MADAESVPDGWVTTVYSRLIRVITARPMPAGRHCGAQPMY